MKEAAKALLGLLIIGVIGGAVACAVYGIAQRLEVDPQHPHVNYIKAFALLFVSTGGLVMLFELSWAIGDTTFEKAREHLDTIRKPDAEQDERAGAVSIAARRKNRNAK